MEKLYCVKNGRLQIHPDQTSGIWEVVGRLIGGGASYVIGYGYIFGSLELMVDPCSKAGTKIRKAVNY